MSIFAYFFKRSPNKRHRGALAFALIGAAMFCAAAPAKAGAFKDAARAAGQQIVLSESVAGGK